MERARTSDPPCLDGANLTPLNLLLVAAGALGGLLFAAVWLVEGAMRPGYKPWSQSISLLSLGAGGGIQQAAFVGFGVLILVSAAGWRQALAGGAGAVAYPMLRAVEGVALAVDGIFSQDPVRGYPADAGAVSPSLHGEIHLTFAVLAIAAVALGWFVLARRLSREKPWRRWAPYASVTGVLVITFIAIFGALGANGSVAGVFERLATVASLPLGLAIVVRLLLQGRERDDSRRRHIDDRLRAPRA